MLLAIDVGNTQTVYGVWDRSAWRAQWRRATKYEDTEDEIIAWLKLMFELDEIPLHLDGVVAASVVPSLDLSICRLAEKWLKCPCYFLRHGDQVGIPVDYQPTTSVGADRIANVLAAKAIVEPPFIVVDFGTATTFDVVDARGHYLGGSIMTGVEVSSAALFGRTAKLPQVSLEVPEKAIGQSTPAALQSGIMFGYAGAVDAIVSRIRAELGSDAVALATGGLGGKFIGAAKTLDSYHPMLTLDGLVMALPSLNAE